MRRFKSLFTQFAAWPRSSTRRTSRAIRSTRAPGTLVPVTSDAFWWAHEPDQPRRTSPAVTCGAPRIVPNARLSTVAHAHHALSGFLLWFGMLFSAALIGTFIVLGIVLLYALLMSVIGH